MSRNPLLTDRAFDAGPASPSTEWAHAQATGARAALGEHRDTHLDHTPLTSGRMTLGGVVTATGVLFAVLLATAAWGWTTVSVGEPQRTDAGVVFSPTLTQPWVLVGALVAALVLAITTSLRPRWAPVTGVAYAACEGVVLGMVSAYYGALYGGIVAQAVLATLGVFLTMLVLYGLRVLRATPRFVKGVVAATFGVAFMYLGVFVLNLFGVARGFWSSGSTLGLAVSVVVVCVAALNLILDFDFIERGTARGLPRHMDWYAGFGLLVTLVWLYLEMLRLLARLRN